jgi:hypothetical protein
MPDLDQIKQGEQGARDRCGRFAKGRLGNPAARRTGSRNKATLAAAALLEGGSDALGLVGDPTAMRLCLERNLPRCRERTVEFALPPIESAADIAAARWHYNQWESVCCWFAADAAT